MASIHKLINGFRVFRTDYLAGNSDGLFEKLVNEGQAPQTLVIACSDSRNDPALLTNSAPGDLFSVRNIAALVPPCEPELRDHSAHGTGAAIDFAVRVLKVKHVLVLGHALCGGVHALSKSQGDLAHGEDLVSRWIGIASQARDAVRSGMGTADDEEQLRTLEQATILTSMQNLLSFPSVRDAIAKGDLDVHGWYFDMPHGKLLGFDDATTSFRSVLSGVSPALHKGNWKRADHILSLERFVDQAMQPSRTVTVAKKKRGLRRWLGAGKRETV